MSVLPPCPHLPAPRAGLDWRALHEFRHRPRDPAFYLACLEYGHALWQRGLAGRAILCLDRALGADMPDDSPVFEAWPWPYAALAWMLAYSPRERWVGNPRVHFQHYAGRMNEPRREQRRWRAWACWAIARRVRPELPGDSRHVIAEPADEEIEARLRELGLDREAAAWRRLLQTLPPTTLADDAG